VMEKIGLRLRSEEERVDEETGERMPIVVYAVARADRAGWVESGL